MSVSAPSSAAARRARLHALGRLPPRTKAPPKQRTHITRPTRPTRPPTKRPGAPTPANPLLKDLGAPTYALRRGNPTPAQFLKSKLRMLKRAARQGILDTPEGRRALTRYEPFLWALIYVPHYLVLEQTNSLTLSQFHVDAFIYLQEWSVPSTATRQDRDGWVAPRESGKSTIFFTIGPLWAACHDHLRFIAAFSDSDDQVQKHLAKFHENIDNNTLLQQDYPQLCTPARRPNGNPINDNKNAYVSSSRFTFEAHTVDGKIVGLVDAWGRRPDMIILDDIEPSEDKYSPALKQKGITRLTDKILYLNEFARVTLVGTVTMAGSIMHDIVLSLLQPGDTASWVKAQNFKAHYYPALSIDPNTGELTSLWPEKWPVAELKPRLGTNDFMKNMQNNPTGSGDFWEQGDITYDTLANPTITILSVDPAVTVSERSDYTGLAVIRYQPQTNRSLAATTAEAPTTIPTKMERARKIARKRNLAPTPENLASILQYLPEAAYDTAQTTTTPTPTTHNQPRHSTCEVAFATRVKMRPTRLSQYILSILERFPEIAYVLVETNQGMEFTAQHFDNLPVPVKTIFSSEPKDTRIARLSSYYKYPVPRVVHAAHFQPAEEEMYAYPATQHDDTADAIATGVLHFLHTPAKNKAKRRPKPTAIQTGYTKRQHRSAA